MFGPTSPIETRIRKLQAHLEKENPILLDVVKSFRQLDRVAYRLGLLAREESFATRVPWWPMIAVLGTFSSGKSTFINAYLRERLQETGNQAVDDKFTVICYAGGETNRVLPGRALDADPRFPFYQMSHAIEQVAPGEGKRVDVYLQLKTCRSERLRGKILIDSPGFDADEQRNSTLRITDHIMDLSDLVLVFFDARRPEPGAMHDTLEHLVGQTIRRADSTKFLYILNQIDNAAREDNPEAVFAAWQRALAQKGLTAGRFFSIYDLDAAVRIDDPKLRQRFETKRAEDMAQIEGRLQQVEVERAYRIIGVLEHTAKSILDRVIPTLRAAKRRWRRRVLWLDGLVLGGVLGAFALWSLAGGYWEGWRFAHPWLTWLAARPPVLGAVLGLLVVLAGYVHVLLSRLAARSVLAGLGRDRDLEDIRDWLTRAFRYNVRPWQLSPSGEPSGWGARARRRILRVLADADRYVQSLNNRFADPSGSRSPLPARDGGDTAPGSAWTSDDGGGAGVEPGAPPRGAPRAPLDYAPEAAESQDADEVVREVGGRH